jgi:hypothetical protein
VVNGARDTGQIAGALQLRQVDGKFLAELSAVMPRSGSA